MKDRIKIKRGMPLLVFLFLFFMGRFVVGQDVATQRVVGFAPHYRSFSEDFDFSKFTHIHFFTVWTDSEGNLVWPQEKEHMEMFNTYENLRDLLDGSDVKLLITFGGGSRDGAMYFPEIAQDSLSLHRFVYQATELCRAWNADGIDIDWEWRSRLTTANDSLRDGYTKMMLALREKCDEYGMLLSADIAASSYFGVNYPVEGLEVADYLTVMTYSYNGTWAETADHHASFKNSSELGIDYWLDRGLDRSQLCLGVPFYGYLYNGASARGDQFDSGKPLFRKDIDSMLVKGYTQVEDDINGTYCYSLEDDAIAFYDSPDNLAYKMKYVEETALGGMSIWEIGHDNDAQLLTHAVFDAISEDTVAVEAYVSEGIDCVVSSMHHGQIVVHNFAREEVMAVLYSINGRMMNVHPVDRDGYVVLGDHLSAGVYLVLLAGKDGAESRKVMVR